MKNFLFGLLVATAFFTACQSDSNIAASVAKTHAAATAPEPTTCWENRLGQDLTAIQLTINGSDVSGYMAWEPYEKDGARGSLKGTKTGDIITAMFDYMIEGNIQAEEVMFKLADGKLMKANNELEQKAGVPEEKAIVLVIKDKTNIKWDEVFTNADCATLQGSIERAKMSTDEINEQK